MATRTVFHLLLLLKLNAEAALLPTGITPSSTLASDIQSNLSSSKFATLSQPIPSSQSPQPLITGPAFSLYSDYSSSTSTVTVPSGVTTRAYVDGNIGYTLVVGPTTITQSFTDRNVGYSLYSTSSISFPPWDPAPFYGPSLPFAQVFDEGSKSIWPATLWNSWLQYTEYARKPACTADYSSFIATQPQTTVTTIEGLWPTGGDGWGAHMLTGFGYTTTVQDNGVNKPYCCGYCAFIYLSIDLFYWPEKHGNNTWCLASTSGSANISDTLTKVIRERTPPPSITSAVDATEYATDDDGFVYTSPSIYLKFSSLLAEDDCGPIGPQTWISTILAFAPGQLTTLDGWCTGRCRVSSGTFDPANMPCGEQTSINVNWEYGDATTYTHTSTEIGSATLKLPRFLQPPGLNNLFPGWSNCTADFGWMGFDPPHTLERATAMRPSVTSVDPAHTSSTPASPGSTTPPLPINTAASIDPVAVVTGKGDPPKGNIRPSKASPSSNDPATIAMPASTQGLAGDPHQSSSGSQIDDESSYVGNIDGSTTLATPTQEKQWNIKSIPFGSVTPSSDKAKSSAGSSTHTAVLPGPGNADAASMVANIQSVPALQSPAMQGQDRPQVSHWAIAGLTFSAVDVATQEAPGSPNESGAPRTGFSLDPATIPSKPTNAATAGQTPSTQALGLMIDDKTLHVGDPPISISGTVISLGPDNIVIGTDIMSLASPIPAPTTTNPPALPIFTLAGIPYTANSNGIVIGSATLLPGSPATTISGTPISLAPSQLIIGTSTLLLPTTPPISPLPRSFITIGSHTLALGTSAIVVAGNTLTPDAPAITVNGEQISLGSSLLVVGTRTESFLPLQASATSNAAEPPDPSAQNVGALIMSGLGSVGGGTMAAPSETGIGSSAAGGGATGSAQTFMGGAMKRGCLPLRRSLLVVSLGLMVELCSNHVHF